MSLYIPVILGTIREGRKSLAPAKLMVQKIVEAGHTSELVDFKELPLPFLDSEKLPAQLGGVYPYPNVQTWSDIAAKADAFIIVTPEYNHSYPAVLKNALDWLYPEFDRKPVGLVGVSSGAVGGARAIEQLRPVMENFSMFAVRETVMFTKITEVFDDQGNLKDEHYLKSINGLINSVVYAAEAMKSFKH